MSETVTMTLTEFLLARIAEDESARVIPDDDDWPFYRTAQECAESDRWKVECEAKRRIVELHGPPTQREDDTWRANDQCTEFEVWPCETLRLLALPYAEHPDYELALGPQ